MSPRKFLFTYRYQGEEYGLDVVADSFDEAKGRVSQMSLARYDGEVFVTIAVPGGNFLSRLFRRADRGRKGRP